MEDQQKQISEYLQKLREPLSFKQLQEHFSDVDSQKLKEIIDSLNEQNKINIISIFLTKKVKCDSVRMEYIETEIHPMDSQENNQSQENQDQEIHQQVDQQIKKFEPKKHEDLNDEQLQEYKAELIAAKSLLEEKKKSLNTKSDKLKKIQERNEMKEVAGSIFQRIANIRNLTTKQVFSEYGLDNNEI
ncbi:Swi5 protein (macronuclear) [Tetrahymena thermophila SB210]|uniref:Swi5 protein n=1 Tax=Tetrahymena thermophila (strain SB210) TaxID=312017 RepID=I7MCF8_TETTS|nr:Swi5 protein [Tetrahymena thermophila SB210]EAR83814.2 Swi5 protein [Tetrahymena thermophila SB210]|eukprot:XP_001031477.2 Swi5 protein [Tetrahymena thermophila SB210]